MKRPYLFSLSIKLNDGIKPIKEIAVEYLALIKGLCQVDKNFSNFIMSKDGCESVAFDIKDFSDEKCVKLLSEIILDLSRNDILKYDGVINPDVNWFSPFGFSWITSFSILENEDFYLTFRLGSNNSNSIGNFNFPKKMLMDFEWMLNTFMLMTTVANAVKGGVYFLNSEVLQAAKESNIVFGWVTYFSNNSLPTNEKTLNDIKSITTDKGKYYILSKNDISLDKTEYELAKNKVISLIKLYR